MNTQSKLTQRQKREITDYTKKQLARTMPRQTHNLQVTASKISPRDNYYFILVQATTNNARSMVAATTDYDNWEQQKQEVIITITTHFIELLLKQDDNQEI